MDTNSTKNSAADSALLHRILTRQGFTILLGCAALVGSAIFLWYVLPGLENTDIVPRVQIPFRITVGAIALLVAVAWFLRQRMHLLLIGSLILGFAVLFPHVLMVWQGPTAGRAAQLLAQANNLDIEIHKTYFNKEVPWDETIELSGAPKGILTFKLLIQDKNFFHPAHLPRWLDGYGLGAEFFQFVNRGWILALIGGLLLIFAHFLDVPSNRPQLSKREILWLSFAVAIVAILPAIPISVGNYLLYRGSQQAAQGNYLAAIDNYEQAQQWIPCLAQNSKYHSDLGALYHRNHRKDYADYYVFTGDNYFNQARFGMAKMQYARARQLAPNHPIALYNYITALLDIGIEKFNQGQFSSAAQAWQEVLRLDANHLYALYNLSAAYIMLENYDLAAVCLNRVLKLQEYFQTPPVVLTSQVYMRLSWCAMRQEKHQSAWELAQKAVSPGEW